MNSINRNQQQASIGITHLSTTTQALLPRYLIAWLVCVALALGTAMSAQADESDFVIHEVNVDFTSNTLTIKGEAEDFDFEDEDVDLASDLEVTLGEIGTLGILSVTETEIVAALPAGIPDGDYLLTVTVFVGGDDDDDSLSGRYDLTIGAVGPQGDKGEKGEPGSAGATGPAGPPGTTGSIGPAGGAPLFNQSCPSGEFVQGIDSSGKLLCAAVGFPTPPPSANNCTVTLESFGSNKLGVIKAVRAITGLGLKEAKDLVEAAPSIIKQGISKLESDDSSNQLQQAGAIVSTACAGGTL